MYQCMIMKKPTVLKQENIAFKIENRLLAKMIEWFHAKNLPILLLH